VYDKRSHDHKPQEEVLNLQILVTNRFARL
jgi:hypothetical protein